MCPSCREMRNLQTLMDPRCIAQLVSYSLDQFSRQLATAGLASNITSAVLTPVRGFTLGDQMRVLNGLPLVDTDAISPAPSALASPPPTR